MAGSERDSLAASEVGYYMDVLYGRLKQVGRGAAITRQRDGVAVNLQVRGGFQPSNTQVAPSLRDALAPFAKALVEYRKTLVSVRVRGSQAGSAIDDQREQAVAQVLMNDGIAGKRILVAGNAQGGMPSKSAANETIRIELLIEPVVRP